MDTQEKTLVVIGGGAAGFFCGVNAAKNNSTLNVIIVEKSSKLLSKVKVSGGGRCNVTHHCFEIEELIKKYPRGQHFLKKAFHHFNTAHTIQWFEERGIALKAEEDGRMFPQSNTSQTVIDCLLKEANKYNVQVMMNADVKELSRKAVIFHIQLRDGRQLQADYVCIASGGFSKPEHFYWLQQLGHNIELPVPSLFTFNMPGNPITALMGVSVENTIVKITGTKLLQQGPILITHWGLSGPAVLKLSAYAARELAQMQYHFSIIVNWLPQYNEQTLKEQWLCVRNQFAAQAIGNKNPFGLPARLWQFFLQQADVDAATRWTDVTSKQQNKLIQTITAQPLEVNGKTTFKEEFVTCGGIKLSEINASTMQSRIVPNLFFAGEVMDVDGITGGFNFQHAWTSGWIAAEAIAKAAEL
jgi:predicted Rossmann fold flavoprotein